MVELLVAGGIAEAVGREPEFERAHVDDLSTKRRRPDATICCSPVDTEARVDVEVSEDAGIYRQIAACVRAGDRAVDGDHASAVYPDQTNCAEIHARLAVGRLGRLKAELVQFAAQAG